MVGAFVRQVRESRSMSQAELAEISGIAQPNISAIETGDRVPTAETLNRLLVGCGYQLAAAAGERVVGCELANVGWFPDDDDPGRLDDDPAESAPRPATAPLDPDERAELVMAVLELASTIVEAR